MHGRRAAYYVVGENILSDAPVPPGGAAPTRAPALKFGRLFGRTQHVPRPEETDRVVQKLIQLGRVMNLPAGVGKGESDIPAGYTYLGQFIAHEVTFDSTGDLLQAGLSPDNLRTPQIDLDSLYGSENGPKEHPKLYKDGARLKVDNTSAGAVIQAPFPHDLPRGTEKNPRQALIGDPRNDENLALAQTHVAFIHFHNKIVEALAAAGCPSDKLFETAREQVIRHYQWIILYDFLPQLVRADVLDCVMRHGLRWFKGGDGAFMPLEFSAAAFRIGHTMVRNSYEWNPVHRTDKRGSRAAPLMDLFRQTGFLAVVPKDSAQEAFARSILDGMNNLTGDWIIDWRHFYDFSPLGHVPPLPKRPPDSKRTPNFSARLDTIFDLHLDTVEGFPGASLDKMQQAITVRNLLRGFYLGLPTGEEAAEWIGETPLTRKQVASGPHEEVLDDPVFWGKTPLWYYVLKEAELFGFNEKGAPGNRLGPVGSRIVAETLVGLVRHSRYSILEDAAWRPAFGHSDPATGRTHFGMIDLLSFADVVDPLARFYRKHAPTYDLEET